MSKSTTLKPVLLTVLIIIVTGGLVGYAAYLYQADRKPVPAESASQLRSDRDSAVQQLSLHDAVNKRVQADLSKQVSDTQAKVVSVCASLKTTKVTNVNCQ